ncbi:hypothetical protein C8R46DRAFT_1125221, partial [Mycena filopes]
MSFLLYCAVCRYSACLGWAGATRLHRPLCGEKTWPAAALPGPDEAALDSPCALGDRRRNASPRRGKSAASGLGLGHRLGKHQASRST